MAKTAPTIESSNSTAATKKRRSSTRSKSNQPAIESPEKPDLETLSSSDSFHCKCQQEALHSALENMSRFAPEKPPQPILDHVLLQANAESQQLVLTIYNLKAAVRYSIAANIEAAGTTTVPIKLLKKIIAKFKGEVILQAIAASSHSPDTIQLHLNDGDGTDYQLPTLNPKDFPAVPSLPGTPQSVATVALKSTIQSTIYAASSDEKKPILTGIQLIVTAQSLKFHATDAHRIAICTATIAKKGRSRRSPQSGSFTLPSKVLKQVDQMLSDRTDSVNLYYEAQTQWFGFEWENVQVMTHLLQNDQFPDCEAIINSHAEHHDQTVILEKVKLLWAVDRLSALADPDRKEPSISLRFVGTAQQIELIVENGERTGFGREIVLATFPSDLNLTFRFNLKYLLDSLRATPSSALKLHFAPSPVIPVSITTAGDMDNPEVVLDLTQFLAPQKPEDEALEPTTTP